MANGVARYDAIAEWYAEYVGAGPGLVLPVVPTDVRRHRVVDLGCGEGRTSRHLASLGAVMTGLDLSSRLIAMARDREASERLGIEYAVADAANLDWWDGDPFDGAVSEMMLMDCDDLEGVADSLAAAVRPGGWTAVSLFHPCFPGADGPASWPEDRGYHWSGRWVAEGAAGVRGSVGANHRPLATYLTMFLQRGFSLEQVVEPPFGKVPAILLLRFRKAV